jgi:hypothetical protein
VKAVKQAQRPFHHEHGREVIEDSLQLIQRDLQFAQANETAVEYEDDK